MSKLLNLYNKYRPKSFSEIIGQDLVKKLLVNIFYSEKLIQSFIFYGPSGTGKTSVARIFAKAWNCRNFSKTGDVCNNCNLCNLIDDFRTTDIYEIDAASNSGVDNIRELIDNCQYMPMNLDKKIYLIDECHNLSASAWNALLKVIEEPFSESIIFIFVTTNIHKIPETILSRCQKYCFFKLNDEDLLRLIERVSKLESRNLDPSASSFLTLLSRGSARECLNMMEQLFLASDKEIFKKSDLEKIFFIPSKEDLLQFLDLLLLNDLSSIIAKLESWVSLDKHLFNYFSSLLSIFIDLHVYEKTKNKSLLVQISEEEAKKFIKFNVNFLKLSDVLFESLKVYEIASSKLEWAKILSFKMIDFLGFKVIPKNEDPKPKEKEVSDQPQDFFLDEKLTLKLLYGLSVHKQNSIKTKENYEIYKGILDSENVDPDLKELLSRAIKKNCIWSTDKTIVLFYDSSSDAIEFNNFIKNNPIKKDELNRFFFDKYEWIAIPRSEIKTYSEKSKLVPQQNLNNAFLEDSRKVIFEEMMKVLGES